MSEKENYDSPEIGTVFPLRSKYSEEVRVDFVKKIASILESMDLISGNMKPAGLTKSLTIRLDAYLNKFPVRKQKGFWIDGGKQVGVFNPDSFLPFFMNNFGSKICRLC